MVQWFKDIFSGRGVPGRRGDGAWYVMLGRLVYIPVPPGLPAEKKWEKWAFIQEKILSGIQRQWPEAAMYIRFNAFPPGYFEDKLRSCESEKLTTGREEIFLLPDCRSGSALDTIFSVLGIVPFTRCVYILDRKPANWQEVIGRLFEATRKIAKKQPVEEYRNELEMCRCLAYSKDQDLVIGKIDLPRKDVISILEGVAKEEHLEITIREK